MQHDEQNGLIVIDDKLQVNITTPYIWKFRVLLDDLIQRKVRNPRLRFNRNEEIVLETFDNILSAEDSSKGLFHPPGVGDRPLFIYQKASESPPNKHNGPLGHNKTMRLNGHNNHYHQRNDEFNPHGTRYGRHPYRTTGRNNFYGGGGSNGQNSWRSEQCSNRGSPVNQNRGNFNETASPILINAIAPKNIVIPNNARFFVIRPTEIRNIIISVSQGTWNFSPQTEKKIFRLFMVK